MWVGGEGHTLMNFSTLPFIPTWQCVLKNFSKVRCTVRSTVGDFDFFQGQTKLLNVPHKKAYLVISTSSTAAGIPGGGVM